MKEREAVVILAAGVGSRMGPLTENTSKCILDLNGVTPIEHTLKSFSSYGVKNAIIVVGYKAQQVKSSVDKFLKNNPIMNVTFVHNKKYNYHGCEYSLACAAREFRKYRSVYITEGDLLLDKKYVEQIVKDNHNSSVLIRPSSFIDETRSVLAVTTNDLFITRFVYDPNHNNVYEGVSERERVLGESVQLWKFARASVDTLSERLIEYKDMADASQCKVKHSGLYSINKEIKHNQMYPIKIDGIHWINLNTYNDVLEARKAPWINRDVTSKMLMMLRGKAR